MGDDFKISKQELQEMLDTAADQAVTKGIAFANYLIRKSVKEFFKDASYKFISFAWKPLLLAALGLAGYIAYKLRNWL